MSLRSQIKEIFSRDRKPQLEAQHRLNDQASESLFEALYGLEIKLILESQQAEEPQHE